MTIADPKSMTNGPRPKAGNKSDSIPHAFGPCRVLVADDEHLVATGIANALKDLGHTVVGIAGDGQLALAMAREHKPDLALLDIRMPGMNGIELAKTLNDDLHIPSLIISAYSDEEHISGIQGNGLTSGVFGYLLKPVGRDELRVAMGIVLHRSAVNDFQDHRIGQLETNLANRRTVEQAKWKMVENKKITEAEAHEKLQRLARDQRRPLVEVAKEILEQP